MAPPISPFLGRFSFKSQKSKKKARPRQDAAALKKELLEAEQALESVSQIVSGEAGSGNENEILNATHKVHQTRRAMTELQIKMENIWVDYEELIDKRAENLENQVEVCFAKVPSDKPERRSSEETEVAEEQHRKYPKNIPGLGRTKMETQSLVTSFEDLSLINKNFKRDMGKFRDTLRGRLENASTLRGRLENATFSPDVIRKRIVEQFSSESEKE